MDVDFMAVCDAVLMAWKANGESIPAIALRFGVSRGWIHKWAIPNPDAAVKISPQFLGG